MSYGMIFTPDWAVTVLTGVLVFLVTLYFLQSRDKRKSLPPGPFAWPAVGNLPQILGKDLHIVLTNWAKLYGDIVWARIGVDNVLIVNNMNLAKETMVKHGRVFSGRPKKRKTVEVLLGDGTDIAMADISPELKFHRNTIHSFFINQRRSGRLQLENIISIEADSFSKTLQECCDRGIDFDPKLEISRVVANVLCQCILNQRFDRIDESFEEQLRVIKDIIDNIENFNIVDVFPWLERFPIPSWVRFKGSLARLDQWLSRVISEHKDTLQSDHNRDLLDMLLNMQLEAKAENDEEKIRMLSDRTIGHIVHELFGGGIESTTMAILWFMIYLMHNPEWQDLIANEVLDQYGEDEIPSSFDRRTCPQLEAAIKETLRLACVLPVGFPHRTMKEVNVRGYKVPADTMVIVNTWAIHHDNKAWHDPYTFNPERFLENRDEKFSYLPFGIGNRVCLGSSLATMEVFVYCAVLVSRFKFRPPDGDKLPELKANQDLLCGLIRSE
ncbi:hypothetical protein ScPMuIL_012783 [Solemya velum]